MSRISEDSVGGTGSHISPAWEYLGMSNIQAIWWGEEQVVWSGHHSQFPPWPQHEWEKLIELEFQTEISVSLICYTVYVIHINYNWIEQTTLCPVFHLFNKKCTSLMWTLLSSDLRKLLTIWRPCFVHFSCLFLLSPFHFSFLLDTWVVTYFMQFYWTSDMFQYQSIPASQKPSKDKQHNVYNCKQF